MLNVLIDLNGTETQPTHGPIDIAAALAEQSWQETPIAKAIDNTDIELLADGAGRLASEEDFNRIRAGHHDAARHAARIGFALARTSQSAELGWPSWLKAAQQWLADNGCGPDAHLTGDVDAYRTERASA